MNITRKTWNNYISLLRNINTKAADELETWINVNFSGREITADYVDESGYNIVDVAYIITNKYGNSSAAVSAGMYDSLAELSDAFVSPAELAPTPEYGEVAKTVQGVLKTSQNVKELSGAVSRLVKRTGADTTLKNAERDRAQFAWVPNGDTCAFCLTLASRGWQYMSKKALKNGHAEHIHSNCDCTYAIRFDKKTQVEGYDPDKYREMYENAEGNTPQERINSMRREQYAARRDEINSEKRIAYRSRKDLSEQKALTDITQEYYDKATPGRGTVERAKGFSDVNGEARTADWIQYVFGGDIICLADDHPEGELNPDYLWNGKLWDLKSPTSSRDSTIKKRIKHGIEQIAENPGGVIIDITNSDRDIGYLEELLSVVVPGKATSGTDFLIKDGARVKVIRYN